MRVGLCGWTISTAEYVRRFPLVEIQHTFYEPPNDALLMKWRAQAPPQFEFTIKAWQLVTHESKSPTYRRMKQPLAPELRGQVGAFRTTPAVLDAWTRTLECAHILRATAVLLQCPPSFKPTSENIDRMHSFLTRVDRPDGRLLWEPRGDWAPAVLEELCREHRLVHVVDPMQTETVTPDETYYRLHGTTGSRHVHTDEELAQLRDRLAERLNPYVLFNNLPRVGDAARFMALVGRSPAS